MKKVYKYATGVEIPEDAIYLSTQVEKTIYHFIESDTNRCLKDEEKNSLVWHYFLVEVKEKE